jgi:hypothetical protein
MVLWFDGLAMLGAVDPLRINVVAGDINPARYWFDRFMPR